MTTKSEMETFQFKSSFFALRDELLMANKRFVLAAEAYGKRKQLTPRVALIGSSRLSENDPHYLAAKELSEAVAGHGISTLTTGTTGIGRAVIEGSHGETDRKPLSLTYSTNGEEPKGYEPIHLNGFLSSLNLLNMLSNCLVAFRPGIGTLAKVMWVLQAAQLINAGKQVKNGAVFNFSLEGKAGFVPKIILFDSGEWHPLLYLLQNMEEVGTISLEDRQLVHCTSSIDETSKLIFQETDRYQTFIHENKLKITQSNGIPLESFRNEMVTCRKEEIELLIGMRNILPLEYRIIFSGSTTVPDGHPEFLKAVEFGTNVGNMGIPIVTEGGPSMMHAPLMGVAKSKFASLLNRYASGITLPGEKPNPDITIGIEGKTFSLRSSVLGIMGFDAFAKLGGIGTALEASIQWKLAQIYRRHSYGESLPVPPPIGRFEWHPMFGTIGRMWEPMQNLISLMAGGKDRQATILPEDLKFFYPLQDYAEALNFVERRFRDFVWHMRIMRKSPIIHNPNMMKMPEMMSDQTL